MELEIEPLQLSARLTLHEALLTAMYRQAFADLHEPDREAFIEKFMAQLRFKMNFQYDDGEVAFELQRQTCELAEGFFRKVKAP
ncbi:MAG: hypothetical protein PHU46_12070 [Rhodocyclaceae bacterium]|nr:hypothetical protein [Rhodocyclaceae bacterium]